MQIEQSLAGEVALLRRPTLEDVVIRGGVYDGRKWAWVFPDTSFGTFEEVLAPLHDSSEISHFRFRAVKQ
jgi:hypothetical protein